jgi:hypothetical protein
MIIGTGNKAGKSSQEILLKEADWAQFFIAKNPTSKVATELRRHATDLDAKPFTEKCHHCKGAATRLSYYSGNPMMWYAWCASCDPYWTGARRGMLTIVATVSQALRFVDSTCQGRRTDKRIIVRQLAEAKGLPKRVGQATAIKFLP